MSSNTREHDMVELHHPCTWHGKCSVVDVRAVVPGAPFLFVLLCILFLTRIAHLLFCLFSAAAIPCLFVSLVLAVLRVCVSVLPPRSL